MTEQVVEELCEELFAGAVRESSARDVRERFSLDAERLAPCIREACTGEWRDLFRKRYKRGMREIARLAVMRSQGEGAVIDPQTASLYGRAAYALVANWSQGGGELSRERLIKHMEDLDRTFFGA